MVSRPQSQPKRRGGFVGFLTLVLITAMLIVMGSLLMVSRQAFVMTETLDLIRQRGVLQSSLENIVLDAVQARQGLALNNPAVPVDTLIGNYLDLLNAQSQGVTVTLATSPGGLPGPLVFYPSPLTSAQTPGTPNDSTPGIHHRLARLLHPHVHFLGASEWVFNRTGSRVEEAGTHRVVARFWTVPFSNWTLIPYGLPTLSTDGSSLPGAPPSGVPSALAGLPAEHLLLTRLNPNLDTTVRTDILDGTVGGPEALPRIYRQLSKLAWDAWEYILSPLHYDLLVTAPGADLFDFGSFTKPLLPGVEWDSEDEDLLTIRTNELSSSPEGTTLVVFDGEGHREVELIPGPLSASNTGPLVLVFRSFRNPTAPSSAQLAVRLRGEHQRTILIYLWDTHLSMDSDARIEGGLILSPSSRLSGGGHLSGTLAWHGTQPYPSPHLSQTVANASTRAELAQIIPRALLVSTSLQ